MATEIKCPGCGHGFPMEEAMTEEYKKELREKMLVFTRQKDEEYQRKMEEFNQREQQKQLEFERKLTEERHRIQHDLETNLQKTIIEDFENKLIMLESSNKDTEEKLKLAGRNRNLGRSAWLLNGFPALFDPVARLYPV